MKFTAILALASGALAVSSFYDDVSTSATASQVPHVTYTTEVVTAITTYCPAPTKVTYGGSTYTITEATTLTITDCPCTIKKPITTISSVVCNAGNCPPVYHNSTSAPAPVQPTKSSVGTVTLPTPTGTKTGTKTGVPPIATAGAGKTAALSGGALAGVLGLAALVL
ncbi:hypothetical protein VTI74DRAFT_9044 [Chaetomium olivicolor]